MEKKILNNTFNGYGNFKDIKNSTLRNWNRVNTYYNIRENHGTVVSTRYLEQFRGDIKTLARMFLDIKNIGYEQVRRDIMKGIYR